MSGIFRQIPFPERAPIPRRDAARRMLGGQGPGRAYLILGCFVAVFAILALRMGQLALTPLPEGGVSRSGGVVEQRATITDRDGRLLASTMETWEVFIRPRETARAGGLSPDELDGLKRIFPKLDRTGLRRTVEAGKSSFYYVSRLASARQWSEARDLGIVGMEARARSSRVYPSGRLVAHILGGVNIDNRGVAGIERGLEKRISDAETADEPLRLSIDLRIQNALRDTLYEALSHFEALGAAGLVLDVRTGELLALVSLPDFDPNHRPEAPPSDDIEAQASSALFNRATQGAYELGSVFKLLTAATALDSGTALVDTVVDARFPLRRGGFTISDYLGKGRPLTLEEVIQYSSNIGAVRIAELYGVDIQRQYLNRFGIVDRGRVPLAELPTAELGRAQMPQKWESAEAATVSYGHGISVTPMHLATTLASLANDGCRVTPTLLYREGPPEGCDRLVSREVSVQIRALMRTVGRQSSGRSANIAGYEIGGKTGTAYKVKATGGYDTSKRFNTFVALWPTSDPKYLMMVSLDDPKILDGSRRLPLAGRTAAPAAGRAIERIAPLLGDAPADRFRPAPDTEQEITEGGALPVFIDDNAATNAGDAG